MVYVTGDRDLDVKRDLNWWTSNHPDWIVSACGGSGPAWEFADKRHVPIDLTRADARRFHLEQIDLPALTKSGFPALAVDNMSLWNDFHRCPATRAKVYSGAVNDPAFASDVTDWIDWLGAQLHSRGKAMAVNFYFRSGQDPLAYLRAARAIDIVVDEHGFTRKCRPMDADAAWQTRIQLFRALARTKAVMIIDQICQTNQEMDDHILDWSLANYLLIKGDRTYIDMVAEEDYYGKLTSRPVLDTRVGRPLGEPAQRGGVWFRDFEYALALVNPSKGESRSFDPGANWRVRATGLAAPDHIKLAPGTAIVLVR